jgi:nitroimidazol reductase NimA-like FMN-containing flavoprotein (pyridoxamine 5'-phosphate oxidase superfamily)
MPMPEDNAPEIASQPPVPPAEMERRAFVRRMTTDTVGLAGRVFGLSKAMTRGAVAAGQAVRDNIQAVAVEQGVGDPATEFGPEIAPEIAPEFEADVEPALDHGPGLEAEPERAIAAEPEPAPAARTAPAPMPEVLLTAEQAAVLEAATSAVLAVNGRGAAPLAQPVAIHWDGETLRFASLGWSRRATAIQMEPRVALVVEAPGGGVFVVVEGTARFEIGPAARDAMAPLLSREGDQAEADRRWAELVAADPDRVVVFVRPTKVLTGRRS